MIQDNQDQGVPASPSGSQASPAAPSGSAPTVSIPNAICAYPLPGWRLEYVQWDERKNEPDGWIVSLHRERPRWTECYRAFVVMARSDVGPLEAWDEALRVALREDAREAQRRAASAIEARSDETRSGSAEGESAVPEADAHD